MCKAASAVPERSGGMEAKAGTWNVAPAGAGPPRKLFAFQDRAFFVDYLLGC